MNLSHLPFFSDVRVKGVGLTLWVSLLLFTGCFWSKPLPSFEYFDAVHSENGTKVAGCEYIQVGLGEEVDLKDVCSVMQCDHGYGPLLRSILGVYEDVQRISEMSHKLNGRQRIIIYKDAKTVQDVFGYIFGKIDQDQVVAFYWSRKDTVILALETMDKSILAHEMTHMLVDLCNKGLTDEEEEDLALKVEMNLADWYGE